MDGQRESPRRGSLARRGSRLDKLSTPSLRRAIVRLRRAIANGTPHDYDHGATFYLFARAQRILFERSGEIDALASAEAAARGSVELTSRDDPDRWPPGRKPAETASF